MRYHVLACDYDNTLAHDGHVSDETLADLERLLATGCTLILVTGRELGDLLGILPEVTLFHRVVAENGALLYDPSNRQEKPLAPAIPEVFARTLRERGVRGFSVGRGILSTHWLPPDNRQECPRQIVTLRTSPTNIGMGLLANLAACDLGYVTASAMFDRTARTLHSMLHLEQYHGHFYNWYDTSTLRPPEPRYVSTVDSGNLWAALIVLHAGAGEMRNRPLLPPRLIDGVRETLAVIASLSEPLRRSPEGRQFEERFVAFHACCDRAACDRARDACRTMRRFHRRAMELAAAVPQDQPALVSWSGSMFEHLMPTLIMPSYQGTFLDASCRAAVRLQMDHARRLGIPWGISESSYNATNEDGAYAYRAFGVPGLGLERGLGKNLVVAPHWK
ncbi:MAG: HAD hydrolase family protein [Thermoguttaceae bacterium]